MKKLYIFLIIIGLVLSISLVAGFALSKKELSTYVANVKIEATSGYPPHLTIIQNEGVVQETALISIMPQLSLRGLSISESVTTIDGIIKIDCGGEFQETKNFNLFTDNPGDKMIQRFTFKKLPSDSVCFITAQALECETHHISCTKNKISLMVRTPQNENI